MFRKAVALALAVSALGLVAASSATAGSGANGILTEPKDSRPLGKFRFRPGKETVAVHDRWVDSWSVLVELWWGGKLRRVCWDSTLRSHNGLRRHTCDFSIPEGKRITFFMAEARKRVWKKCWVRGKRAWRLRNGSRACGKRPGYWVGEKRQGDYGFGDFRGVA
jgi:hypothetical protein